MPNFDIKTWVLGLLNIDLKDMGISMCASYIRRGLDSHGGAYDKIAALPFFQELKKQGRLTKYLFEAANNAVVAFLDQKIGETTPLRKLLKEIFLDAGSELNKRLINGESPQKILSENADKIFAESEKNLLAIFLMLPEEKAKILMKELLAISSCEDRTTVIQQLRNLSAEEVTKIAGLDEEARQLIYKLFGKQGDQNKRPGLLTLISTDINEGLDLIHEKLQKAKQRRRVR
ncbi:MAG: hypothetical protein COX30_04960 [Candidatus Moranbacteria bacterium CG23_combo_of_CG06-09_8_20_14_all_39_10]|nr:MAG: hypothetical protein COX30_04960 [Candidatus Moranbacteria bacterium CG23_combo_of_CG06-09_8_20_14_all_39_10]